MENLQHATENICRLKGEALGMQCMINAIMRTLSDEQLESTLREFHEEMEIARVTMMNSEQVGEFVLNGLETYAQQVSTRYPGQ